MAGNKFTRTNRGGNRGSGVKQLAAPESPQSAPYIESDGLDGEVVAMNNGALGADIPPHVWALLQSAGEIAAQRLVQVLKSPAFSTYAPSAQRGLIELALTRAYGLPIRKALNVTLTSSDSDAVAASLADLSNSLPEHVRHTIREAQNAPSGNSDLPPRSELDAL